MVIITITARFSGREMRRYRVRAPQRIKLREGAGVEGLGTGLKAVMDDFWKHKWWEQQKRWRDTLTAGEMEGQQERWRDSRRDGGTAGEMEGQQGRWRDSRRDGETAGEMEGQQERWRDSRRDGGTAGEMEGQQEIEGHIDSRKGGMRTFIKNIFSYLGFFLTFLVSYQNIFLISLIIVC